MANLFQKLEKEYWKIDLQIDLFNHEMIEKLLNHDTCMVTELRFIFKRYYDT